MKKENPWKDYRNHLKDTFGVKVIDTHEEFQSLRKKYQLLMATGCSAKKIEDGNYYKPSELYLGTKNINFYKMMKAMKYDFGTLSDLHGLCLEDEKYTAYDTPPYGLPDEEFERLGKIIKIKTQERGYNAIMYYNPSPIMGSPYFKMLKYSELPIYYFTKLNMVEKQQQSLF